MDKTALDGKPVEECVRLGAALTARSVGSVLVPMRAGQ